MALLENLVAGNVYIVKISASNEVGEGPFSNSVELAVLPKDASESNQRPKRLDSSDAKGLDAATVTGFFFYPSDLTSAPAVTTPLNLHLVRFCGVAGLSGFLLWS